VLFTEIRHLDNRREKVAPLDKSQSSITNDAHRKLAFSTLTHDTLGTTPLEAGVVNMLRTSTKNSVRELTDYTTYKLVSYFNLLYSVVFNRNNITHILS